MTTEFETAHGFARSDVTIANWRTAPYSRWSFQNLREMVPTAEIRAGAEEPEAALSSSPLLDTPLETGLAGTTNARAFLDHAHTDAFVLMKGGRIVAEHYAPHAQVNARHIVFSISKSLTALVSAVLEGQGVIDPDCPVVSLIPEAEGSAYGDCSYRDVLDMRVSLDFDEAYLDKNGAFARYRRSTLWNPSEAGAPVETLTEFLMTIQKADRPAWRSLFLRLAQFRSARHPDRACHRPPLCRAVFRSPVEAARREEPRAGQRRRCRHGAFGRRRLRHRPRPCPRRPDAARRR